MDMLDDWIDSVKYVNVVFENGDYFILKTH